MTREEAIKWLKDHHSIDLNTQDDEAHRMAIKALEQEPRRGHWIRVAGGSLIDDYRCDCCNHQPPIRKVGSTWGWDFTDYCPNCGVDMREVTK